MPRSYLKTFNQVQSKSKIPDFERGRIEVGNHSNPAYGGISRIDHLDPTPRLGLRGVLK